MAPKVKKGLASMDARGVPIMQVMGGKVAFKALSNWTKVAIVETPSDPPSGTSTPSTTATAGWSEPATPASVPATPCTPASVPSTPIQSPIRDLISEDYDSDDGCKLPPLFPEEEVTEPHKQTAPAVPAAEQVGGAQVGGCRKPHTTFILLPSNKYTPI